MRARFEFRWEDQFQLSLDPERAQALHDQTLPAPYLKGSFLLDIGPPVCSMEITQQLRNQGRSAQEQHQSALRQNPTDFVPPALKIF